MIGYVTQAGNVAAAPASAYELSRPALEHEGRWRAFRRSAALALFLLVLQVPLLATATGRLASQTYIPAVVPARLSLIVDLAMVAAYLQVALRALELMWSVRCSRATRQAAYLACGAVGVGAVLDVVEDVVLWRRAADATAEADMTTALSWAMRVLVILGELVLVAVAVRSKQLLKRRSETTPSFGPRGRSSPSPTARNGLPRMELEDARPSRARPGLVIACSGGGVRSASFSLGALQMLNLTGHYARAEAVVGVSGGGYMAAAFHAARWQSTADPNDAQRWSEDIAKDVFSPSSPEQHWLRNNTRYMLKSKDVALQGLLSLLYGMAVNVALLAALVLAIAWFMGWYLNASGALVGWDTADASALEFPPGSWSLAGYAWLLPVAGLVPFLVERLTDRFHTIEFQDRQVLRRWTSALMLGGLLATATLIGVPVVLAALHDVATRSGSAWAQLLQALGFASQDACAAALAVDGTACGVTSVGATTTPNPVWFGTGSLVALATAVLAVLRSATSAGAKPSQDAARLSKVLRAVWGATKHVVIPWIAALVVVTVIALALLRTTAAFVDTPSKLASWRFLYAAALLLVFVRLLTDANRTSLHHFYRERLSFAYLVRRRRGLVAPIDYEEPLRFSASAPPEGRGPRLVACAVANVSDSEVVPEGRGCTPFVFDDAGIGMTDGLLPTEAATVPSPLYEYAADRLHRDATIPAAMAMSGAAFSPLAGRLNRRLAPYRLVLAVGNARLGVWLPNPLWVDDLAVAKRLVKSRQAGDVVAAWKRLPPRQRERLCNDLLSERDWRWLHGVLRTGLGEDHVPAALKVLEPLHDERSTGVRLRRFAEVVRNTTSKPGPYRLMKEAVGRTSIYDRRLYVTDGGHYDNLGLLEALRRRPREIIVIDASADPEDTFQALGLAIATARMDLDCEVSLDPRTMKRVAQDERAVMAWGKGSFTYSDGVSGDIWLAKAILTDGLPWDVETYAGQNASFPRTSTGNQLYGELDLEAYRVLGREVIRRLVRDHPAPVADEPSVTVVPPAPGPAAPAGERVTVAASAVAVVIAVREALRERETRRRSRRPVAEHPAAPVARPTDGTGRPRDE